MPAGSGTSPDPRSSSRPQPRPPGQAELTGRPDPPPATHRRPDRYGLTVAAGTPATHPVAGTLSRNPECDIDARGPTSCRRSRLRAHQESGNRCALAMAPAWTLTLDYPQYRHHTLVVAPRRILLHVLAIPVGNCGSPIGVHAGRCPCGGRKCGVELSVENVDRPRPDQQRRSILPAGVPSTSSTGHPRPACRDKAQRRGPASGCDSRVLTPRPSDTAHCARLVTRSLVRFGRRPRYLRAASAVRWDACRTVPT